MQAPGEFSLERLLLAVCAASLLVNGFFLRGILADIQELKKFRHSVNNWRAELNVWFHLLVAEYKKRKGIENGD